MIPKKRPSLIEQVQQAEMTRRLERLRGHLITVRSMTPATGAVYSELVKRLTKRKDNAA